METIPPLVSAGPLADVAAQPAVRWPLTTVLTPDDELLHVGYLDDFASIGGIDGESPFVAVTLEGLPRTVASRTPLFASSRDAGEIQIER